MNPTALPAFEYAPGLDELLAEPGISYPATRDEMDDLVVGDPRAAQTAIDEQIFALLVSP